MMGADRIEFQPAPSEPAADHKLPEATVVSQDGAETIIKVDTTQPAQKAEDQKSSEVPEWVPAEHVDEYKAYLEFKAARAKEAEAKPDPTKLPDPKTATPEQAAEAVTKAGLDMNALAREYAENGELSAESLAKLEKAGIGKDVVEAYIEGQKAQVELAQQRIAEALGGRENLEATLQWAATALTPEEIDAANLALSTSEVQARLVLIGLNARRLAEMGSEPGFVGGRAAPANTGPAGYESTAQMIADMNSPQYRNDPAFREHVMRRLAASKF